MQLGGSKSEYCGALALDPADESAYVGLYYAVTQVLQLHAALPPDSACTML